LTRKDSFSDRTRCETQIDDVIIVHEVYDSKKNMFDRKNLPQLGVDGSHARILWDIWGGLLKCQVFETAESANASRKIVPQEPSPRPEKIPNEDRRDQKKENEVDKRAPWVEDAVFPLVVENTDVRDYHLKEPRPASG
jgi:hypothetical protein